MTTTRTGSATVKNNSATAKTATNEKKATNSAKKATNAQKKQEEAKEEQAKKSVLKQIEKFEIKPLSAEERIERMQHFEALSKRYTALKTKANDLKTFGAGNDSISSKITFINQQGFEFTVQNSNVIATLVKAATIELETLLADTKNEVETFEI
ncbi:hypothetical protein SAMN05216480_10542 [Pustulibacterium marinum]|uniref:Uncharacterized protein n=1 Tax=Pustulibacterium marinum TaxID=1224947 RepID=A0A1I7GKS2_9FLAO|nr:hypothetical protein [Pustulibacterium marinum]SFU49082.1 hypothetical protein SAMN05216480_10542 [Pustulibacterium marinum]